MAGSLCCTITLPAGYRSADIIAYHLRDPMHVGETWEDGALHKAMLWQDKPARLELQFDSATVTARLDASGSDPEHKTFTALVRRMTGLDQDIDAFESAVAAHPQLGPLVRRQAGLRVPVATTPYEALIWAITGQQISVQAAVSIRRRFIMATGARHGSGLICHPDAATVAEIAPDALRATGLSASKAATISALSQAVAEGELPLDAWLETRPAALIRERLLAVRGIGPWTADYTLLRGYGWLDGSLHGDAAVRRSLASLLQKDGPVSQDETRAWLAAFSPWRALAAAHLWAGLKLQA